MYPHEIDAVNHAKPDYIGFVFANSRLRIDGNQAEALRQRLSPHITPVGVFVNEVIPQIAALLKYGIIDMAQLHGDETESYIEKLKSLTDKQIIKAVAVLQAGDAQKWQHTSADYILLDNKGGASGKPFNWDLVGKLLRGFFLAGGLTAENIVHAIEKTNPYAVDISTGAELNGYKDKAKILALIEAVRGTMA